MKTNSSSVALMDLPYPAWRLLMHHLWADHTFRYFFVPRFRSDGSVTVLLLGNGGPTRQETPAPHPAETSGRRGEAEVSARNNEPSEPSGKQAVSQRRQLGG